MKQWFWDSCGPTPLLFLGGITLVLGVIIGLAIYYDDCARYERTDRVLYYQHSAGTSINGVTMPGQSWPVYETVCVEREAPK